jgi:hypothetical protein
MLLMGDLALFCLNPIKFATVLSLFLIRNIRNIIYSRLEICELLIEPVNELLPKYLIYLT